MTMSSIASARPTALAPCSGCVARCRTVSRSRRRCGRSSSGCVLDPGKAASQKLRVADIVVGDVVLADQVGLELGDAVVGTAVELREIAHERIDGDARLCVSP